MKFRLIGFDKYNPRSDAKSSSWFRLENDWLQDGDVFEWSNDKRIVWIYLVGLYSAKQKRGSGEVVPKIASLICKITEKRLFEIIKEFEESQVIEILEKCHTHDHSCAIGVTDVHKSAPYERTNVRTNDICEPDTNEHKTGDESPADKSADVVDLEEIKKTALLKSDGPDLLAELWNESVVEVPDAGLPKVKIPISGQRLKRAREAIKQMPHVDDWRKAIVSILSSEFHTGKNDRGWKADFDWLLQPTKQNYLRMAESYEVEYATKNI